MPATAIALTHLHVLELGAGVASAYVCKLLAEQGCDVVKVEPQQGDALRRHHPEAGMIDDSSGYFAALNVGKRSCTVDSDNLEQLICWADIVVHDLSPLMATEKGIDAIRLLNLKPELVVLAITAFGSDGPEAEFLATDLILGAAGGWSMLCPATSSDPALPPLKVYGDQCYLMASISAAAVALATARNAANTGEGEFIDFSVQAYVASVLEAALPTYTYKQEVATRCHERRLVPWKIFHAIDGPVFIVCIEQDQWARLLEFMGNPDWSLLDVFVDQTSRAENQDMVHMFVQEFVGTWHAMDFYHEAQKHRVCVAPVLSVSALGDTPHLLERDFFKDVQGTKYLAAATLRNSGRAGNSLAAPQIGAHTQEVLDEARATLVDGATSSSHSKSSQSHLDSGKKPLDGIRVLDMTWAWAGPFCTMNLAHMGADVIRLESEVRPDLYRRLSIFPADMDEGINRSGMFNQWNQGKSSIGVDLSKPAGIELVKSLVAESDVLVQNFATGVMERLGLSYDVLAAINPRLIMASVSGYGQVGPWKEYIGYGPAMPPLTGLSAATGYVDGAAQEIGLSMPDPTAGITAAWEIVAAITRRDQSGRGDHLDVSLWEATAVLNMEAWMQYALTGTEPKRQGNGSQTMCPHGIFPCRSNNDEESWIAIACESDDLWQKLAPCISDELLTDQRFTGFKARKQNEQVLNETLSVWTATQDRYALANHLQSVGIAAYAVMTTKDIVDNRQLGARGFIERLDHPEVGRRAHTGIPWRFRHRKNGVQKPAPCLGADTVSCLRTLLAMDDAQIERLIEDGVVSVGDREGIKQQLGPTTGSE